MRTSTLAEAIQTFSSITENDEKNREEKKNKTKID